MNEKPNVILMLIDDLGYGDVSCLNEDSKIATPNIDALTQRGMIFTDAHATSALCTPSRYGVLTGRYNWRSRMKSGVLMGSSPPMIEEGRMTIANLFKDNGYFTACVGKWHQGMDWPRKENADGSEYGIAYEIASSNALRAEAAKAGRNLWSVPFVDGYDLDFDKPLISGPCDKGFDYFFGMPASIDQPPYVYIENDRVLVKPDHVSGVTPLDRNGASQQQLWQRGPVAKGFDHAQVLPDMQKKVVDLIDQHHQEPFFIYYPTPAVHGPLLPTPDFAGKSGINAYADVVLMVDDMVGQITRKLKDLDIWENTIFVFVSDNGCSGVADYPLLLSKGHNPSYIFRGKKADIYEGGHRVPAIVSWPGQFDQAHNCDQIVCLSDFFRTFADLLDSRLPDNAAEDSMSLLPLLNGSDETIRQNIIHSSGSGAFSIRGPRWKLELCRGNGSAFGATEVVEETTTDEMPYQLYDMVEDAREKKNLANDRPDIVAAMKKELLLAIENGRTSPGIPQQNSAVDKWPQVDQLKVRFKWEE